jgi:hypothetical protein
LDKLHAYNLQTPWLNGRGANEALRASGKTRLRTGDPAEDIGGDPLWSADQQPKKIYAPGFALEVVERAIRAVDGTTSGTSTPSGMLGHLL